MTADAVLVNDINIPETLKFYTLNEAYYLNPIIAPENATNKEATVLPTDATNKGVTWKWKACNM